MLKQSDKKESTELPEMPDKHSGGSVFKFWVTDRQKHKLDYARSTALLYTLNLVFGGASDARLRTPSIQHSMS